MIEQGELAPDFEGVDQNGKKIALHDFKGKKVALYFYPKDNTPGCTAEACNLRDNYEDLLKAGIAVIGVSVDSIESHKKFETKFSLPFPLVADTDRKIVNLYGVWGQKKFMGKVHDGTFRTTFLIDENGIVKYVIAKPKTNDHFAQIIETWKA